MKSPCRACVAIIDAKLKSLFEESEIHRRSLEIGCDAHIASKNIHECEQRIKFLIKKKLEACEDVECVNGFTKPVVCVGICYMKAMAFATCGGLYKIENGVAILLR